MVRSVRSNLMVTTRYLQHLNQDSLNKLKQCIYEQLECKNEGQFLVKALNCMCHLFTSQSSTTVKNKSIEISESQMIADNDKSHQNKISVYKYVQEKNRDILSRLHSDTIDYFSTFLTKKQSVELGYLNKQLYIESQKLSFLTKRIDNEKLVIRNGKMDQLIWGQNIPFAYNFPNDMELFGGDDRVSSEQRAISDTPSFKRLFSRLNCLYCNVAHMSMIPFNLLFAMNKNNKDYPNCPNNDDARFLQKLSFIATILDEDCGNAMYKEAELACNEFIKYRNCGIGNFRKIREFDCCFAHINPFADLANKLALLLLITFGSISQSISVKAINLTIDSFDKFCMIFHNELKVFKYNQSLNINLQFDTKNILMDNNSDNENKFGAKLKEIHLTGSISQVRSAVGVLNLLDRFNLRKNVNCYQIDWNSRFQRDLQTWTVSPIVGNCKLVLDKLFLNDYDKHPLLKKIVIKLTDDWNLHQFAMLLIYFSENCQGIFVATDLERRLKHLSIIEIEWKQVGLSLNQHFGGVAIGADTMTNHQIFKGKKNEEYSIDDKMVEICNVDAKIDSFAIIYANVIDWFKRIEQQLQYLDSGREEQFKRCLRFSV